MVKWFEEHLMISGYRPRTITNYLHELSLFRRWLESNTIVSEIDDLTVNHLKTFTISLYENALAPKTVHAKLSALKCFFSACYENNKLYRNLASALIFPKIGKKLPTAVLTEQETETVFTWLEKQTEFSPVESFAEAIAVRDRLIWELLYSCGLRNSELCSLSLDSIRYNDGLLTVLDGKGGYDRVIPIGKAAVDCAIRYVRESRPILSKDDDLTVLLLSRRGEKLSLDSVRFVVKTVLKSAGITRHIRVHDLRHTCATHMLNSGADIRFVQEHLGHKSLSSTQVYTHVSISRLKQSHAEHHPRERWSDD